MFLVGGGICVTFVSVVLGLPAARDRLRARSLRKKPGRAPEAVNRKLDTIRAIVGFIGIAIALVGAVRNANDKTSLKHQLQQERDERAGLEHRIEGMKDKVTPRDLPAAQASALADAVRAVGGLPHFTVQTLMGDTEAQTYEQQLVAAFMAAGCNVDGWGTDTGIRPDLKGLFIAVAANGGALPEGAQKLANVLQRAGLSVQFANRPNLQDGAFQLIVGGKPAL